MRLVAVRAGAGLWTGVGAGATAPFTSFLSRVGEWLDDRAILGASRMARLGRWDQMRRAFASDRGAGLSAFEIEQCVWRGCEAGEPRAARAAAAALLRRRASGKDPLANRLIRAGRWSAVAGLASLCADEPRFRERLLGNQTAEGRVSLIALAAREAIRQGPVARSGDLSAARRAIEELARCGEAVDGVDESGTRALRWASGDRDPAGLLGQGVWSGGLCETLTRLGAQVEAVGDSETRSPLMSAARALSAPALKALLEAGANPNAQDANGASAAHALCASARWASDQGEAALEGLRALMEAGAEARVLDAKGKSARDALTEGVVEPRALARLERLQAEFDRLEAETTALEIAKATRAPRAAAKRKTSWL